MHQNISIFDPKDLQLTAEAIATLQACTTRDKKSLVSRINDIDKEDIERVIGTYFIGYGHDSIGQLGSILIYFENLSMIATKAIQNNPLYNGQENSTRYPDVKQTMEEYLNNLSVFDPIDNDISRELIEEWLDFYKDLFITIKETLLEKYKVKYGILELTKSEIRAIECKVCDITRGYLLSGTNTVCTWYGTIHQIKQHCERLLTHESVEVRNLISTLLCQLEFKYPNSFTFDNTEKHSDTSFDEAKYWQYVNQYSDFSIGEIVDTKDDIYKDIKTNWLNGYNLKLLDIKKLKEYSQIYNLRPKKTMLPRELAKFGNISLNCTLDFGSYRDIQRHRSLIVDVPKLTKFNLHPFYFQTVNYCLKSDIVIEERILNKLINLQSKTITFINNIPNSYKQYYIPMGCLVDFDIVGQLPYLVYLLELRSGKTVHPTCRWLIAEIYNHLFTNNKPLEFVDNYIMGNLKDGNYTIDNYIDNILDLDFKRSSQTIEKI